MKIKKVKKENKSYFKKRKDLVLNQIVKNQSINLKIKVFRLYKD